jgi:Flp pilus assembly protein TadG
MRLHNERGQSAIEFVILAPVVMTIVVVVAAGARLVSARGDLEAVAREAARAAVTAPPATASSVANQVGRQAATGYGMDPARLTLTSSGSLARGSTYLVVATYNVALTPMPGSMTLQVQRAEPVDPYRSVP